MKLAIVLPIIALMVLLRLMRVGVLVWVTVWWIGMWVFLREGSCSHHVFGSHSGSRAGKFVKVSFAGPNAYS